MSTQETILVVEDKPNEREAMARLLRMEGYSVSAAANPKEANGYIDDCVDLVISDLRMGEHSGLDLLRFWRTRRPGVPFIMVTAYGEVDSAVEAMKLGAQDYLNKPVNPEELLMLVERSLAASQQARTIEQLRERLDERLGFEKIIGCSKVMLDVFDQARRAARVESTVLITGESGAGKELIAEAIHHNSPRKEGPFVTVNMAAVPENLVESELFGHAKGSFTGATAARVGRFESANGGTLFIDEIGDFALTSQAKLLRVLENRTVTPIGSNDDLEVDVRVVAATSRNLEQMVQEQEFREDLYYRLNVVTLCLPPLRERRDDIPLLIHHFLDTLSEAAGRPKLSLDPELLRFLEQHPWPGNVRQLRNCLESMVVLARNETITMDDLPTTLDSVNQPSEELEIPAHTTLEELERAAVEQTLDRFEGNRTHAAEELGISVRTLQRRLKDWGIDQNNGQPGNTTHET
jgi:DNA-binding NtrC family response regulator